MTLDATQYQRQFGNNVNIEQLKEIIKVFNDAYIPPPAEIHTPPIQQLSESTKINISSSVGNDSGQHDNYIYYPGFKGWFKITSGKVDFTQKYYFNKRENGELDFNNPLTSPPTGGSHKRYRKSRKSRKQQSKKKSRRHFQRHKKTHRRKSRTSRRSRK